MMKNVLWTFLCLGLVACGGGWDKDPFVNETDDVKNGQPQGKQSAPIPPLTDIAHLDIDQVYDLKEGEENQIKYGIRISHPRVSLESVEVQDMENVLPGAVLDTKSQILSWTPQLLGTNSDTKIESKTMWFVAYLNVDGELNKVEKKVNLYIRRDYPEPEVLRVEGFPETMAEKDRAKTFWAVVKDPDVNLLNPIVPNLEFETINFDRKPNISGFVKQTTDALWDPEEQVFRYPLRIDLQGTELTRSTTAITLGFYAYNRSGIRSESLKVDLKITNSVEPPYISATTRPLTGRVGELNTYTFDVVDPSEDGILKMKWSDSCERLSEDAECKCERHHPSLRCTVTWTPESRGYKYLRGLAEKTSNGYMANDTFSLSYNIKPAPIPEPEPEPEPFRKESQQ